MTYHGVYPSSEPRLAKLAAYLATVKVRPRLCQLATLLGVAISTVQKDLAKLEARGVAIPPSGSRYTKGIQCSIIASRQRGQSGWMVYVKGCIGRPDQPVRLRHWCADFEEAIAIQQAISAGQTVEDAIHELMK